jgi:uncharacterized membrane protein
LWQQQQQRRAQQQHVQHDAALLSTPLWEQCLVRATVGAVTIVAAADQTCAQVLSCSHCTVRITLLSLLNRQTASGCLWCSSGCSPTVFLLPVAVIAAAVAAAAAAAVAPAGYARTEPNQATACSPSTYAPSLNRLARCLRCQSGLQEAPNSGLIDGQRDSKRAVCSECLEDLQVLQSSVLGTYNTMCMLVMLLARRLAGDQPVLVYSSCHLASVARHPQMQLRQLQAAVQPQFACIAAVPCCCRPAAEVPPGRFMSQGLVRICPQGFWREHFLDFDHPNATICHPCSRGVTTAGAGAGSRSLCNRVLPGHGISTVFNVSGTHNAPVYPSAGADGLPTATVCDLGSYSLNGFCARCLYDTVTLAKGATTVEACSKLHCCSCLLSHIKVQHGTLPGAHGLCVS